MQAKLFDVAEDEEGVLDDSIFDNLLQVLILYQVGVYELLHIRGREPDHQVRLEWELVNFQRPTNRFGANNLEDHVLGAT